MSRCGGWRKFARLRAARRRMWWSERLSYTRASTRLRLQAPVDQRRLWSGSRGSRLKSNSYAVHRARKRWGRDEDMLLVTASRRRSVAWLARRLGRSESAIRTRLCRLGVSARALSTREIARRLGIRRETVTRVAKRLGFDPDRSSPGLAMYNADQIREITALVMSRRKKRKGGEK